MPEIRTKQRFQLALPTRITAGRRLRNTKTKNVSAGGVLFEADPSLRVGSRVQFSITLPRQLLGVRKDVDVKCDGRVVRVERKNGKAKVKNVGVACIIDNYAFVRRNRKL